MAAMAKDEEGKTEAREAIQRFNEKNPGRRIQPMQLAPERAHARQADSGGRGWGLPAEEAARCHDGWAVRG